MSDHILSTAVQVLGTENGTCSAARQISNWFVTGPTQVLRDEKSDNNEAIVAEVSTLGFKRPI